MSRKLSRAVPFMERFCSAFVEHESGCWLWLRGKNPQGYGVIELNGRCTRAHRASWLVHNGEIPAGLYVCHHCDTPSCVNPAHLFLGTATDNNTDCIKKGRRPNKSGERNHNAKLSDRQADEIRKSRQPAKALASQYGVSIWTVYDIRAGRHRSTILTREGMR